MFYLLAIAKSILALRSWIRKIVVEVETEF